MTHITPRSIKTLEDEIAALEAGEEVITSQVEEEEEEEEAVSTTPVSREEETWKKRYSDLRSHSQKREDALKQELDQIKREKAMADLPTQEEAEKWALENPQAASIIRAITNKQVEHTAPRHEDVHAIKQELEKSKQEARIRKVHPDFEEVTDLSNTQFHDWIAEQTQSVQDLIYSGNADDVIWAVSLFKKETKQTFSPNKDAAKAVNSKGVSTQPDAGGKKKFSESQVQSMSLSDYEKNADAIHASMQNGTFSYDLSGGAR